MIRLSHGDSVLDIDPAAGNLPHWRVGGRVPLHAAPWREEAEVQADPDLNTVNKRLAGDFFCMPFGPDDVAGDPQHGHTANAPWVVEDAGVAHARLSLSVPVRGAHVTKEVRIAGAALYQTHIVQGGAGEVTFAHHPMMRMAEGGRLSYSPKRAILTDPLPQYAGHNLWSLNQIHPDLYLDCEDGTRWDMRNYPTGHAVEDFAILLEARGTDVGWTVLMRAVEDDMIVVLKDARVMPVTMLWISNGGRDFPPWNGRHTGVIGIEDGCAAGALGLRQALDDTRLTAMGAPVTQALGGRLVVRHAMLSLPRPEGWSEVVDITLADGQAILRDIGNEEISVPFDTGHFA